MRDLFSRFAAASALAIGSAPVFSLYLLGLLIWLVLGPLTHFSDTWQLWANTITSLGTTAICLLIQNSVNRDTKALHVKLDELLRANKEARTGLVDVEHRSEHEVDEREQEFARVRSEEEQTRP